MSISASPIQQAQTVQGSSPITVTISAPAAGNCLIALIASGTAGITVSGITGGGVTWSKLINSNTNRSSEIWVGPNSSGSGTSVQVTMPGVTLNTSVWVVEFSGVATSSPGDASGGNNGNSGSPVSTSITPTASRNALLLACGRTGNTPSLTSGGFTALATSNSVYVACYQVVSSTTGAYQSTYTASSATWEIEIADILAAAVAGGVVSRNLLLNQSVNRASTY